MYIEALCRAHRARVSPYEHNIIIATGVRAVTAPRRAIRGCHTVTQTRVCIICAQKRNL